jgi:hypothetical protein
MLDAIPGRGVGMEYCAFGRMADTSGLRASSRARLISPLGTKIAFSTQNGVYWMQESPHTRLCACGFPFESLNDKYSL